MVVDPSPNGTRVLYLGPGNKLDAPECGTDCARLQPIQRLGDLAAASPR